MLPKDAWRVLAVCLVLGLGTIGLYSPAFDFSYVSYDDPLYVINNPHVNQGLAGAFGWAFKASYGHAWQPLTWLSHAFDCQIFGIKPGGHHATSLILHALNSVLVFLVLRQLTGAFWRSAAVAAFFAWHPLHVESAAWISERKGLLVAFFWLLSLWAYTCYAKNLKSPIFNSKIYYAGAVVLFALALMSGPVAVTFPLILLLLDWWPLGRLAGTSERPASKQALFCCVEKIPFFVLSIAVCVINALAIHRSPSLDPIAQLPFKTRIVTAGMSCFRYVCKSFWPSDLGAVYPFGLPIPKWELAGVALALIVISIVVVTLRKTRPYGLAGWLWFLAALFPVLNLAQTGAQPFADRYMYLPSIGLWMLVCWAAYDATSLWPQGRLAVGGLCALLLAACCVLSWKQINCWENEGTLLARIPQSDVNSFGHFDYARYLLGRSQLAEAQTQCEKAISILPEDTKSQVLLGDVLLAEHKVDQSIQKYQFALTLDPNMGVARLELGRALLTNKRLAEAAVELNKVLTSQPKNFEAHNLLAETLMFQGKTADAVAEYRASLKLQLNQAETLNNLAWLLATDPRAEIRHGAEALGFAQRACQLTQGKEPFFVGTLAAAYAETGDFDKAVEAANLAHDTALALGRKSLADTNSAALELYRAHKPFRQKQGL